MKKNNKKGFTIVELVIVIAVIAILAAVLIPTFSSVIKKAKVNNDIQLVRNLNTALATDTEEHKTMQDALDAAFEFGYDVAKINDTSVDENEILWDSKNDVFCYLKDGTLEYVPNSVADGDKLTADSYLLWKISDTVDEIYSTYYTGSATTINTSKGFDAGKTKGITAIKYENTTGTAQEEVVIRTNGGTLTVNGKKGSTKEECDEIVHYGFANVVNSDVGNFCFYTHGTINQLNAIAGKVIADKNGIIYVTRAAGDSIVERQNGGIVIVPENADIAANATVSESTTDERYIAISTAEQLKSIRDNINNEQNYNDVVLKLTADIDLSGEQWTPIGDCHEHAFAGTIDGNNYTIKLAFAGTYNGPETAQSSSNTAGDGFGLIGWATGSLTVKDLTLDVNFNLTASGDIKASYVGGLVGIYDAAGYVGSNKGDTESVAKTYNVNISNVVVNGAITGADKVGGLFGSTYISDYKYSNKTILFNFDQCTNNATVSGSGRVGGIVGTASGQFAGDSNNNNVKVLFNNCNNTQAISSTSSEYKPGGIAGFLASPGNYEFKTCNSVEIPQGGKLFGRYHYAGGGAKPTPTTNSCAGVGLENGFGYLDFTPVEFTQWDAYDGYTQISITWKWLHDSQLSDPYHGNAASYYVGTALSNSEWRLTIDGNHYRCAFNTAINGVEDCTADTAHIVNTVLPENHWTNAEYSLEKNGNTYIFTKDTLGGQ